MALQSQMRCGTLDDIPGLSDDIKRMYQILKRMESVQSTASGISDFDISDIEELDSDDEAPSTDLSKRLEGISLNDADAIWSKLTDSERQEFGKIVNSEDVSSILPPFTPWWETKIQKVLISDMNCADATTTEHQYATLEHPEVLSTIADFSKLSSKQPAPCVQWNLMNVLGAYAITARFFIGDHHSSPHEAANYLISICANLKTNANFDEQQLAIESIRYESHNEGFTTDESDMDQMKKDVDNIVNGPDSSSASNLYILAALSDLHSLLVRAKSDKRTATERRPSASYRPPQQKQEFNEFLKRFVDHKIADFDSVDKTKLSACIKKIEYYLAFVKMYR